MARASSGDSFNPFNRTIRLIACCQPSGVRRSNEMRVNRPFSSFLWQAEHFWIVIWSVTGMPSSLASFGGSFGLSWAGACVWEWTENAVEKSAREKATNTNAFVIRIGGLGFENEIDEWLNDFDALRAASITPCEIKSIPLGAHAAPRAWILPWGRTRPRLRGFDKYNFAEASHAGPAPRGCAPRGCALPGLHPRPRKG